MAETTLRFEGKQSDQRGRSSSLHNLPPLQPSVRALSLFATGAHRRSATTVPAQSSGGGLDVEQDVNRVQQRTKQIDHGLNTLGWMRYRYMVLPHQQGGRDPMPPDPTKTYSKKLWDVVARRWRRQLHRFDLHVDPWADVGGDDDGEGQGADKDDTPVDPVGAELQAQLQLVGCGLAYVAQTVPECSREILDVAYGASGGQTVNSPPSAASGSPQSSETAQTRKRRRGAQVYVVDGSGMASDGDVSSESSDDERVSSSSKRSAKLAAPSQASSRAGHAASARTLLGAGYLHSAAQQEFQAPRELSIPPDVSELLPGPVGAPGVGAGTSLRDAQLAASTGGDFYTALYERYHTPQSASGHQGGRGSAHGGHPVHVPTVQRLVRSLQPTFPPVQVPKLA